VSGGVDSTYCAYKVRELGLRSLAVHLDNGWNSELSVKNIENALKTLNVDLYTQAVDWDEFKDLQLSLLKASTPDSEIPTDHAILAVLYRIAVREGIRFIIIGRNTATECGGVAAWSQGHGDWKHIRSIHKQFGSKNLKFFPHYGPFQLVYYALIRRIRLIPILDYFDYNKKEAVEILRHKLNWKDYGGKHNESIYTRFLQGYILPRKFGFEKKRLHFSSLIWSRQISRERALKEMENDNYPLELQERDKEYVIKKFNISLEEFEQIMNLPITSFWDYPSYKKQIHKYRWLIPIYRYLRSK
jgi:N-acetyl sugar amidotransferase